MFQEFSFQCSQQIDQKIQLTTQIAVGVRLAAICILRAEECWSYIDTLVSGSPILQNGKLIGAVTHVLIDDPTKGYGIFIENMLAEARR